MQIKCKSEMIDINLIKFYPKNPQKHTTEQIDRLCKILNYQGFRHPLIVDRKTNYVVAGNGRLMAAQKLGLKEVPVDYQDFDSDDQLYAFVVSDNAIQQEWAELDLAFINAELPNLDGMNFDIDLLGIKNFEIEPMDVYDLDETEKSKTENGYVLEVILPSKEELNKIYNDLCDRGYIVKIKS